MPTIQLLKNQKKTYSATTKTEMQKLRATAYNNTTWKKLREVYMHEHPLCEECLKKGKVTPAEDIHHIRSPFTGGEINYSLLLDDKNLEAVCKKCHQLIHNAKEGYTSPEDILRQLDALLDNNIPDSYFEDDNQRDN